MAAAGSPVARSHSATPSALAWGMANSRTSKRATQRIPTLALGLSTFRLASLVQYLTMGCDAVHNRQRPHRVPSRGCTGERGTAETFWTRRVDCLRGPWRSSGPLSGQPLGSPTLLGAPRSPNPGGNIVLIEPMSKKEAEDLWNLAKRHPARPWFAKTTAFAQAFATLDACQPTATVHAIVKRQALAADHKRVYRVMKVRELLLDRHAGGVERRHDGRIAVDERNRRANRRTVAGPPAKARRLINTGEASESRRQRTYAPLIQQSPRVLSCPESFAFSESVVVGRLG